MSFGVNHLAEKDDVVARFHDAIELAFDDGQSLGKYGGSACARAPVEPFEAALRPGGEGHG